MLLRVYDSFANGSQVTFGLISILYTNTFGGIVSTPPKGVYAVIFEEMLRRLERPPETPEEEIDILVEAEYAGGVKVFKIFRNYMKTLGKESDWTKKRLSDHLTKPAMVVLAEAAESPAERRARRAERENLS